MSRAAVRRRVTGARGPGHRAVATPEDGPSRATSAFDPARRRCLGAAAGLGVLGVAGCAAPAVGVPTSARVLVVGAGYGGATAARYLRLFSEHRIEVVLVDPEPAFVSCPLSNLVLGGSARLADLTRPYDGLAREGVMRVRDRVARIDTAARVAVLASGARIGYDRLVLSPGVDYLWNEIDGLRAAHDTGRVLQAWQAGPETTALRRQLEALPDGGVVAISIPELPYRCPPGPYERACQIASYLRMAKPRAKVLVLDANPDVTSKPELFKRAWAELYPGVVEYRPQHKAVGVDMAGAVSGGTIRFEVQDDVRADVLNVLPPMRAGAVAVDAGLATANGRWCEVDWLSFESTVARHVHVLGDALQTAPGMPKSGHMASGHGKLAAAAIVASFNGEPPDPAPMLANTCYSFVDARRAMHIASVHAYVPAERTFRSVAGAGGLSLAPSEREGRHAWAWAHGVWADVLG